MTKSVFCASNIKSFETTLERENNVNENETTISWGFLRNPIYAHYCL